MFICNEFTNGNSGTMAGMTRSKGRVGGAFPTQCLLTLDAFSHTLGDSRSVAGMTKSKGDFTGF